mgnify:CR=1 FL=1
MKQILSILIMVVCMTSYSQSKYEPITYVTPSKDTLYVSSEMFETMSDIWNKPQNIREKPVLIKVESITALRTSLGVKDEE